MAPTLASSIQKNFMYDVFLSFTGQDTSKTFVDNLYLGLQQQGITVFKYDERPEFKEKVVETIETRRNVMDYLIRSINDSKFHVIIFSKNYASSSWCLDELVKIMESHKTSDQYTAYPIFYDMEPTEVRNQSVPVGEAAFATHDVEEELVAKRWRDALEEAGDLPGWELKNMTVDGFERKIIQKIVQEISLQLSLLNDWTVDEEKRCLFNQHEFERSGSIEAGVM